MDCNCTCHTKGLTGIRHLGPNTSAKLQDLIELHSNHRCCETRLEYDRNIVGILEQQLTDLQESELEASLAAQRRAEANPAFMAMLRQQIKNLEERTSTRKHPLGSGSPDEPSH